MNDEGKKRIQVTIYGQQYTIIGNESSNYLRMVSGYVDDKMMEISGKNQRYDITKVAVLTAINIADEYFKLKQKYEELLHNNENSEESSDGE